MCKLASFVIVRGEPPKWSKNSDSHEVVRNEHGLPNNTKTRIVNVQVEITPPGGDMTRPVKEWTFRTDQDRFPDWWDAKVTETEVRKELKKWIAQKVITKDCAELRDGEYYIYGGTIRYVYGGTIRYVYGGTIQSVRGGTIQSVESGTIQSVIGGTIRYVYGGTIQYVYGGTIRYVYGGTIIVYTAVDPACLRSSKAVMIDRSDSVVKCYVGNDEIKENQ